VLVIAFLNWGRLGDGILFSVALFMGKTVVL